MPHPELEIRNTLQPLPDYSSDRAYLAVVSFVTLVVLGLISAQFFGVWPETTKRFLWELLVRLTPIRLIHLMERLLKFGSQPSTSGPTEGSNVSSKSAALERILRPEGIPLITKLSRGRAFSIPLLPKSTKPPGLGNWDNSCYQNSMIQGLSSLAYFQRYIAKHLEQEDEKDKMPTHAALDGIISKLWSEGNRGKTLWTPQTLKSMNSWQQQDAQEYFSKMIGQVENETLRWIKRRKISFDLPGLPKRPENQSDESMRQARLPASAFSVSDSSNPLEGLLAQRVGCLSCGHCEGLSMIPFNCLTLSLGTSRFEYDIQDCLDDYTALEQIDGVECAKCTLLQCKTQVERLRLEAANGKHGDPTLFKTLADARLGIIEKALAEEDFSENMLTKQCHVSPKQRVSTTKSKQIVVAKAPQSLVIHVNRSMFDEITGAQLKNNRPVRFQLSLDLSEWILGAVEGASEIENWNTDPSKSMLAAPGAKVSGSAMLYELRAAVTHYGRHENGHYIAYRKLEKSSAESKPSSIGEDAASTTVSEPWYEFSDADVSEVSEEDLLCHNGVFMLFYEAVPTGSAHHDDVVGGEACAPTETPSLKNDSKILAREEESGHEAEDMLPTPAPTLEPSSPGDERSLSERAVSREFDNPLVRLSSDESPSETSDSEESDSPLKLKDYLGPVVLKTTRGFTMRTASDATLSRSHGGRSSESISMPSRSIISAS
ncbi:MAG: hypothetical protein Q9160_001689 [Pyrenula sp. 1 TL-2023]